MSLIDKLRGVRHMKWIAIVLIGAAAILVFTRGYPTDTQTGGGSATALETRLERVLSAVEGAGNVRVMVNQAERSQTVFADSRVASPEYEGVIVVAQGADDLRVAMALQRAVSALLGVQAESVEIMKMREVTP